MKKLGHLYIFFEIESEILGPKNFWALGKSPSSLSLGPTLILKLQSNSTVTERSYSLLDISGSIFNYNTFVEIFLQIK